MSHTHKHHHDHDNLHGHVPDITDRDSQRRVLLTMILIGSFILVEVAGGIYSRSLALLADAGHMLSDFVSLFLAWMAFRVSKKKPDLKRSYGYHRFQVLAAFINALTLLFIAVCILIAAINRLFQPLDVLAGPMLWVAVTGLLVNIVAFWILQQGDRDNLNVKAAALHVLGDLLGSAAAILASVVIMATGWMQADPLLSLLVALIIVKGAWRVSKDAGHILLEGTPVSLEPDLLRQELEQVIPEIRNIHHVHIWSLTDNRPVLTMHADVDEGIDHNKIQDRIHKALREKFNIAHATVQLECERCTGSGC